MYIRSTYTPENTVIYDSTHERKEHKTLHLSFEVGFNFIKCSQMNLTKPILTGVLCGT